MARKQVSEQQKRQMIRDAKSAGKQPSAAGATQGASKQRDHETDPHHPRKRTTHPVE
jgi:hypothetical protein